MFVLDRTEDVAKPAAATRRETQEVGFNSEGGVGREEGIGRVDRTMLSHASNFPIPKPHSDNNVSADLVYPSV